MAGISDEDAAQLKDIYYGVKNAGSFASAYRLYQEAKRSGLNVTLSKVKDWLSAQDSYTLFRRVVRKGGRGRENRVEAAGAREQYQVDLAEVSQYSRMNKGVNFLLVCIDVFSKMAYVRPQKTKTCAETSRAMLEILKEAGVPRRICSDMGKEFIGRPFKQLLKRYGIKHYLMKNATRKAAVAERFIQTLRGRIARLMQSRGRKKYIDALQDIVSGYNHSYHRMIKRRPVDVNDANEADVWMDLYGDERPVGAVGPAGKQPRYRFQVGDSVRVARAKLLFEKGHQKQFFEEVFYIMSRKYDYVPSYRIRDQDGTPIQGFFYETHLQKVPQPIV